MDANQQIYVQYLNEKFELKNVMLIYDGYIAEFRPRLKEKSFIVNIMVNGKNRTQSDLEAEILSLYITPLESACLSNPNLIPFIPLSEELQKEDRAELLESK